MRMTRTRRAAARAVAIGAWLALAAGCRDRGEQPKGDEQIDVGTIPRNVEVRLYVATDWAWNEEDALRVTVVNGTDQPLTGAKLNLFVGAPVDVRVDSAAANTDSAPRPEMMSSGEGTRVIFSIGTLAPGQSGEFAQAIRTPPAPRPPLSEERDTSTSFPVRAWVTAADQRELVTAQDTIRIRAGSDVVVGGCGGIKDVSVTRYGIGPVRLDMKASDVRTLCPEARDTAWRGQEGMPEKGLAVALAKHPVLLVLSNDRISRIVVDTAGLRTGAGVGVGATLADLRARYAVLCTGQGDGGVALWSPVAPGISFGLDTAATAEWSTRRLPPDSLPEQAKVTSMWVRKGDDTCPPAQQAR